MTTRESPRYETDMIHSRYRRSAAVLGLGIALAASACTFPTPEDRAKAAEASAKKSLVAIDHLALEQKVDPEKVKKIQQQLRAVNEYMGEANGKLDQVTVNAYEAFQRSNGLFPDGLFNDKTLRLLEEAAAKQGSAAKG